MNLQMMDLKRIDQIPFRHFRAMKTMTIIFNYHLHKLHAFVNDPYHMKSIQNETIKFKRLGRIVLLFIHLPNA
jgi:hypothetical protein